MREVEGGRSRLGVLWVASGDGFVALAAWLLARGFADRDELAVVEVLDADGRVAGAGVAFWSREAASVVAMAASAQFAPFSASAWFGSTVWTACGETLARRTTAVDSESVLGWVCLWPAGLFRVGPLAA